ncbi:MAG: hypothetical protein AAFQ82_21120, partial [Myxococcota bacterium]
WLLTLFVALGLVLDGLLAFKAGAYLDPEHEIRRELWTLAHAHGTVLSLVHLAFAASVERFPFRAAPFASVALFSSVILMPLGFFLGGAFPYEGDPGVGIWLVPLGGISLLLGCIVTAWHASKQPDHG